MITLNIDPEFQAIAPPLTPDELSALEANLRAEGCREPLDVWDGTIVDGHNRYALCHKHGVEFTTVDRSFESRDHAIVWIVQKQFGRRNVTQAQREWMAIQHLKPALARIGRERKAEAKTKAAEEDVSESDTSFASEEQKKPHKTDATLAKETGTSEGGIRTTSYILKHAPASLVQRYLDGDVSRDRAYKLTKALLNLPEDDRARAGEICIDHDEKARGLVRLFKSQHTDPDSNGTYDEILKTGGFHYGDDMEKWCDYAAADVATIERALKSLAKHHARQRAEQRRAEREAVAGAVDSAAAIIPLRDAVKSGDWWQLGSHRLFCGDTGSRAFVDGAGQGAFAFADPPYNANVSDWDRGFKWAHDWLITAAPVVAVTPGIASIFEFARVTTMPYVWSLSCWIDNGMTRGALGFGNWVYVALFSGKSIYRNAQDIVRVSINASETADSDHKGRKPTELIARLLELFTKPEDVVLDPFLGSGTTLLVAEQMGRTCVGGEINPVFCEDIIARWEDMTGNRAKLAQLKPAAPSQEMAA